jgi:hypothetical protein
MAKGTEEKTKEVTISGWIEEIELEDGNTGVFINDGDEEYYVVMDKQGKRLLDYVDEEVSATGLLSKKHGELSIKITHFELVDDDSEDEDYNDDDDDGHWDD